MYYGKSITKKLLVFVENLIEQYFSTELQSNGKIELKYDF